MPSSCVLCPLHAADLRSEAGSSSDADAAPTTAVVRTSFDPRRVDAWTLVLSSKGLSSMVVAQAGTYELHVPWVERTGAQRELAAADAEERAYRTSARPQSQPAAPATGFAWLGASAIALVLSAFYAVTGPRSAGTLWFSRGASDAARVLDGEAYRAVTALTLHADAAHLLSNLGIGTFVIGAVMRSKGVGVGALMVLVAGTLGNFLNAWVHATHHSSVGFSTAVFAAIGLLGAIAYTEQRRQTRPRRPAWTALAGSVALLAALGASERSDVLAHLFGGASGVALGLIAGVLGERRMGTLGADSKYGPRHSWRRWLSRKKPEDAPTKMGRRASTPRMSHRSAPRREVLGAALVQWTSGLAAAALLTFAWMLALR
jgi:membrane associated rhomboid family serine protease